MAPQASPPTRPRPARGRGGRDPHAGLKARRLLRRRIGWRPALAVAGIPPWRDSGWCVLAGLGDLDVAEAARQRTSVAASWSCGQGELKLPTFGLGGLWQRCQGCVRSWRPCGPIASPSRPASGGRGRAGGGPHRDRPRPDRRGRPDQHGGRRVGAWAWSGAGRESAEQPPSSIPGGWFWGWQRFLWQPARRAARPTRQARWQRAQGPGGREGQAQQRQRQGKGKGK